MVYVKLISHHQESVVTYLTVSRLSHDDHFVNRIAPGVTDHGHVAELVVAANDPHSNDPHAHIEKAGDYLLASFVTPLHFLAWGMRHCRRRHCRWQFRFGIRFGISHCGVLPY